MASTSGEDPPEKKKKTAPISNPPLPHDLLVSSLARVSRLYYPTLSLVSKSFRSLIASPELYKTRTILNRTEKCLYVCLQFPSDPNPRLFTLYRKPNLTPKKGKKKKKESSGNFLALVSTKNSPPMEWSNLVAVGYNLYTITGPIKDASCSNISFLDCRTHTWLEAPSLRFAHTNSPFDGKMYLAGNYEDPKSLKCIEVLDTKTQTWNPVPPEKRRFEVWNMEGNMISNSSAVSDTVSVSLKLKDLTWDAVGLDPNSNRFSLCVVKNITYLYKFTGEFEWSNSMLGGGVWRKVKGLEGLPKFARYSNVKLVNYGGTMVVLWDKYVPSSGYTEKMIWCAEISLERRSSEEIWGKVEWFDAVLAVPKSYKFVYAVTARF